MAIVSNLALLDVIRQGRLLTEEQLATLPQKLQGRLTDARTLARALLQRGWFSVYQINELLGGRGRGLVLGPYHILDRLGQGGQSTVFKARHATEGFVAALKVIRSGLLSNPEASRQFLLEMEAMAKLDHPNIVQFCDADQVGDTYYCAMEYVEGTDLGKYVRLVGPLPAAEACTYVRQAAQGLQQAHEHSLVHRDIKPVNLFLIEPSDGQESEPRVKILDWGLASLRPPRGAQSGAVQKQEPRGVLGTADYLSPEQAMNADTVDIRGDIYSLGCTFYYLLTGQPPFPGGTMMQKLLQHQQAEPTPIESLRPELPLALGAILRRMMAKRPEDRYQTPASVAIALAPYCRGSRILSLPCLGEPRPLPEREPGRPQDDTPMPAALEAKPAASGLAHARLQ